MPILHVLPVSVIPDVVPCAPPRGRHRPKVEEKKVSEVVPDAAATAPLDAEMHAADAAATAPLDAEMHAADADAAATAPLDAEMHAADVDAAATAPLDAEMHAAAADVEMEPAEVVVATDSYAHPLPVEEDGDATLTVPLTAPSADTLMSTMNIKQLRDMCAERGLNTAGKKVDLAARLAGA